MTMRLLWKSVFRNRSGTAGIEFALTAPAILLLFLGGVTVFDCFRSYQKVVESSGIVADLISRQTSIDKAYFDNVYGVFVNLQADPSAPKALRVSSVLRNGKLYTVAWSKTFGDTTLLPAQTLTADNLPDFAAGDSIIYVEGASNFDMMYSVLGFGSMTYRESTFTRPRFIGAVTYTGP